MGITWGIGMPHRESTLSPYFFLKQNLKDTETPTFLLGSILSPCIQMKFYYLLIKKIKHPHKHCGYDCPHFYCYIPSLQEVYIQIERIKCGQVY